MFPFLWPLPCDGGSDSGRPSMDSIVVVCGHAASLWRYDPVCRVESAFTPRIPIDGSETHPHTGPMSLGGGGTGKRGVSLRCLQSLARLASPISYAFHLESLRRLNVGIPRFSHQGIIQSFRDVRNVRSAMGRAATRLPSIEILKRSTENEERHMLLVPNHRKESAACRYK